MIVTFAKLKELSTPAPTLCVYSVCLDASGKTEFEQFVELDEELARTHEEELNLLYAAIEAMRKKGAKNHYFKQEEHAYYLPVVDTAIKEANTKDFGIRLYCCWLRPDLLILLNGGIKTQRNPMDCPNVSNHFKTAESIGRKLDNYIQSGMLDLSKQDALEQLELNI